MLTNPTIDLLRELGLTGMASAYHELEAQPEAKSLEHGEWLALLLERETTTRRQKRFEARARAARLRHDAQVENIDFRAARGLDRNLFLKLAGCDWIRQHHSLLEIIEDRYEKRSTIVTSQVPVDHWYDMIGNPTLADAILDRLVHNAYRIELSGESLRKQRQVQSDA